MDPPALMQTERLSTDPASLARAAEILHRGGLVAFPTETVYGLGARADDPRAVRRIFEAKGRPAGNPLIVHVLDAAAARALTEVWPEPTERLARAFWPGPLTLVLTRRRDRVADEVAAGGPTVAVRAPAHPVAQALLRAAALPIAAPSAHRSSEISPTTAEHVRKALDGRIDAIIDGGPCARGIESTIVDVTAEPAILLRPGAVPAAAVAALIPLRARSGLVIAPDERAPAPGTHARHYAPRARVILAPPSDVRALAGAASDQGARVGVLERGAPTATAPLHELLPDDPDAYAAGLYAALHRLEDAACDVLIIAEPPEDPAWDAIRDRLRRASASPGGNP